MKLNNLLGLEGMQRPALEKILARAAFFKSHNGSLPPSLKGKTVATLFFEPSTRTKLSFQLAVERLGGNVLDFDQGVSSQVKGEKLLDTVRSIVAMGVDALVIRHAASGLASLVAGKVNIPVINAGDGSHEHPTQALLDMLTLQEARGTIDGLNILMVGDIKHSRVVRSSLYGLQAMGANLRLVGPPTMLPQWFAATGVELSWDLDSALPQADVVYLLRIQLERQRGVLFPSRREYARLFGLNEARLAKLKAQAVVMHPGPVNIGAEITAAALDKLENRQAGDAAVFIQKQVENGVMVRMAVLDLLLGDDHVKVT